MANALSSLTHTPRARLTAVAVVFALLVVAAVQFASSADAEGVTITRYSSPRDAMGVDYDRNGNATSTRYNLRSPSLSVGEAPADGHDARAFLPFWISPEMLAVTKDEGTATVSIKVWKAANLGSRHLVIEAYTTDAVAQDDFRRPAEHVATLTPVPGKLGVDVTSLVRAMPEKAYLVLRLRLDSLAPIDGEITRINIGASEAKVDGNRPTLSVAGKVTAQNEPTTTTTPPTTTPPPTTPPTTNPEPPPVGTGSGDAGTTVGASDYPVPSGAIVVSPSGSDAAAGTAAAPLNTLTRAISVAPSGATIVLRAGSYHESVQIPSTKRLTIQAWPNEAVWMDGSVPVSGWTESAGRWFKDGWTVEFDTSPTYTRGAADSTTANWGFVNASYPMAAYPDQIWIDGAPQRQVGSLAAVVPGTFFHDRPANRLWLGSDPTGTQVRVSDLVRALMVRSEGSVIRGFGIRRFAPSVPDMGAVTLEKPRILAENIAIIDTATTGLYVAAGDGTTLRHLYTARNGLLGFGSSTVDNLTIENVLSEDNNSERFNSAPVSGGAKIHRSRGVVVRDSIFRRNNGPGLWMDESVYDIKISGNEMRDNRGHGTSLELSAKAVFADNFVTNNTGFGVKINNTSDVAVWNNTFVGNDRSINIVQDSRRPTSATTAGRDKRQPFPDPTMTWLIGPVSVVNNVMANQRSGNCLLCVEDYSKERTAEQMGVTARGNVYNRPTASSPTWAVVWSRGAGNPAVFTTLTAFQSATGQEAGGLLATGAAVVDALGNPTAAMFDAVGAQPLSTAIATIIGQPTGTRSIGAWTG